MPLKITQLHICGIYNTIEVGNASFVITNDVGREVDMAGPSLNVMRARILGQGFPNHFISLCSETSEEESVHSLDPMSLAETSTLSGLCTSETV